MRYETRDCEEQSAGTQGTPKHIALSADEIQTENTAGDQLNVHFETKSATARTEFIRVDLAAGMM